MKKRATLHAGTIQKLQGRAIPHVDPVATTLAATDSHTPAEAKERSKSRGSPQAPSRAGKVAITIWTSITRRRMLKSYAASHGLTVDELMGEALDDLMKKRRIHDNEIA